MLAIEYENSFVESYPKGSKDPSVELALSRISDFKRVLAKRYSVEMKDPLAGVPSVSIYDLSPSTPKPTNIE